ncbi:hypothetical protein CR513_39223, partial [Mucuna pruriens]
MLKEKVCMLWGIKNVKGNKTGHMKKDYLNKKQGSSSFSNMNEVKENHSLFHLVNSHRHGFLMIVSRDSKQGEVNDFNYKTDGDKDTLRVSKGYLIVMLASLRLAFPQLRETPKQHRAPPETERYESEEMDIMR